MDSLYELQRRKAELKIKIEQQRSDLKASFLEISAEIDPASLLKKAITGALGFSSDKSTDSEKGIIGQLPPALKFLADLFIKDPKWAFVLKWLAPTAVKYLQKTTKKQEVLPPKEFTTEDLLTGELPVEPEMPVKAKIYSGLRRSVSSLRSSIRKTDTSTEETIQEPEK